MGEGSLRWRRFEVAPEPVAEVASSPEGAADPSAWTDPTGHPPDPELLVGVPPVLLLEEGLLPWRRAGDTIEVLCAFPHHAERHLPRLQAALGAPVRLVRAEPGHLARMLHDVVGRPLALAAETRRSAGASCRSLPWGRIALGGGLAALGMLTAAALDPVGVVAILTALAVLALLLSAALRLAAVAALLVPDRAVGGARVVLARLPVISLLLPLYRETEVAATLLARLDSLDYPRDRLDVLLIVEDDDHLTRRTLECCALPPWARIVEVPEGTIRTKPRALNYALNFARGSVIGIYDAEDVPAPDHLRRVAETFAQRWPGTACLQGALDYFNDDRNWLARCFTLEYAGWFRVLLPGLQRLGIALPLGGTTLFLRREALEAVGGWDAHNVTEDADLGIRLARHGYRTEMIPIATQEEANARPWPWIRQRSRWLKGYAVTWAVHMRRPARLWRELGPWRFLGFQVMFGGTLLQFALAPLLWTFWLVPLGLPHPLAPTAFAMDVATLSVLFLGCQILDLAFAAVGAWRAGKVPLVIWAPSLIFYFPLATLALYRALWDLARGPFRWDKTAHGIDMPEPARTLPRDLPDGDAAVPSRSVVTPPPGPSPRRAAAGS